MTDTPKAPKVKNPRAVAAKQLADARKAEAEALQAKHDATIEAVNAKIAENDGRLVGKRKRSKVTEAAPPAAERHDFAYGVLGHDSTYTVNVSEQVALAVPTVYNCVRIIADLLSDAHIGEYRDTEKLPASRISLRPMRSITRRTWLWLTTATMALYNGVYWERVGGTDAEGVPLSLVPVAPVRITWDGENWRKDGEVIDLSRFVYVPRTSWPTVTADLGTVIRLARDAIAAAWAANAYRADFWQAGGAPVLYISTDQPLTNDQAPVSPMHGRSGGTPLLASRRSWAVAVRSKRSALTLPTLARRDAAERLGSAIAQYFGVPAWLANVPSAAGSLTYQNASAAGLDLVRYTLQPGYAGPIGDAWSR